MFCFSLYEIGMIYFMVYSFVWETFPDENDIHDNQLIHISLLERRQKRRRSHLWVVNTHKNFKDDKNFNMKLRTGTFQENSRYEVYVYIYCTPTCQILLKFDITFKLLKTACFNKFLRQLNKASENIAPLKWDLHFFLKFEYRFENKSLSPITLGRSSSKTYFVSLLENTKSQNLLFHFTALYYILCLSKESCHISKPYNSKAVSANIYNSTEHSIQFP